MTYSLLNLVFLVPALVLWIVAVTRRRLRVGAGLAAAAILVALTIIFDNVMIVAGLMVYSESEYSGVRIGLMPFEDLAYALFAAFALPALWALLTPHHRAIPSAQRAPNRGTEPESRQLGNPSARGKDGAAATPQHGAPSPRESDSAPSTRRRPKH